MAYISEYAYYANSGNSPTDANWGDYQYTSLADIVKNFQLIYAGNHSLIHNEPRFKILFHAKRAIQELNYDALKEIRVLQLTVTDTLTYVLPSDFVSYVRVSLYKDGQLFPLNESTKTMTSRAYLQSNAGAILFDESGDILSPENSEIDTDRIDGQMRTEYIGQNGGFDASNGFYNNGDVYYQYPIGPRYGLQTDTANKNPLFQIDRRAGVIKFNSQMAEQSVVLEYITDGMEGGDDSLIQVNKLFEDYVYAAIRYEILSNKIGTQEYVVNRARRKKMALLRNARIRISNMHPSRLLMPLRGRDKWLK